MTTEACQSQGGTLCPQIFGSVSFPLPNNTSLDKGLLSGHLTKLTFWVYFSCIYFYLDCHKKRLLKKKKTGPHKIMNKKNCISFSVSSVICQLVQPFASMVLPQPYPSRCPGVLSEKPIPSGSTSDMTPS